MMSLGVSRRPPRPYCASSDGEDRSLNRRSRDASSGESFVLPSCCTSTTRRPEPERGRHREPFGAPDLDARRVRRRRRPRTCRSRCQDACARFCRSAVRRLTASSPDRPGCARARRRRRRADELLDSVERVAEDHRAERDCGRHRLRRAYWRGTTARIRPRTRCARSCCTLAAPTARRCRRRRRSLHSPERLRVARWSSPSPSDEGKGCPCLLAGRYGPPLQHVSAASRITPIRLCITAWEGL